MKRWMAAACAVAATALVAGTAGSAAAQYPGTNGYRIYAEESSPSNAPCLDRASWLVGNGNDGTAWSIGGVAFSPNKKLDAGLVYDADSSSASVALGNATGACAADPKSLGEADLGTTLSFSRDSTKLAITRYGRVLVISASTGATVRDLTAGESPSWSPRVDTIAYAATDGLRTVPAAGGTSRLWVRGAVRFPDYSPDGTKIAYVTSTGRIAYVDLATGAVTTTPVSTKWSFVWSPDGKDFFVQSTATGQCATVTTGGTVLSRQGYATCQPLAWQATS